MCQEMFHTGLFDLPSIAMEITQFHSIIIYIDKCGIFQPKCEKYFWTNQPLKLPTFDILEINFYLVDILSLKLTAPP